MSHCSQLLDPDLRDLVPQGATALVRSPSDLPRIPYRRREPSKRSTLSWGQRKLLMNEIDFLLNYAMTPDTETVTVVYAGAAPGTHIPLLVRFFPHCFFVLYDPADFDDAAFAGLSREERARVETVRTFFTEEDAARCTMRRPGQHTLFISDIRTCTMGSDDDDEESVERKVREDMARQAGWVRTIRPTASLLKFRLPWEPGQTPYLRGRLLLQPWAPTSTTETRLLVTANDAAAPDVLYDNVTYEEQMMSHNTIERARPHPHAYCDERLGLDECFDCAFEVDVWERLLASGQLPSSAENSAEGWSVARLVEYVSSTLSRGRTLTMRVSSSSQDTMGRWFSPRRYDGDSLTVLARKRSR